MTRSAFDQLPLQIAQDNDPMGYTTENQVSHIPYRQASHPDYNPHYSDRIGYAGQVYATKGRVYNVNTEATAANGLCAKVVASKLPRPCHAIGVIQDQNCILHNYRKFTHCVALVGLGNISLALVGWICVMETRDPNALTHPCTNTRRISIPSKTYRYSILVFTLEFAMH